MVATALETKLRPFRFEDGPAVIDLFNAHSQKLFGWNDSELDDLMNEWTSPGINVEETVRVVENENGEIIGYIDVWDNTCLLYTSPSPRDRTRSRMPSSA